MRSRLDQAIFDRKLAKSKEDAKKLILAGKVYLNENQRPQKASHLVSKHDKISIKENKKYVSRGGSKIKHAISDFSINVKDKICLDAGSSTGGFSDFLLQNHAKKIYAFDVGTNQLAYKIRSNPKVIVNEKFNLRFLSEKNVSEKIDLAVADLSFISLTLILPKLTKVLNKKKSHIIALIKPQFELSKQLVKDHAKNGVIENEKIQLKAVQKIQDFTIKKLNMKFHGYRKSKIIGTKGNQEYFCHISF